MSSLGHGISDAVRNHIPVWVDDSLVDVLYDEYKKTGGTLKKEGYHGFRYCVKQSSDWVRKSRKTTPSGYERLYRCKTVPNATLVVHSPETDLSANAFAFCINGKAVTGGKTKLKSTHVTTALSKGDKATTRQEDVTFVRLSEEELRKMRIQMEYGDGFEHFEFEREA